LSVEDGQRLVDFLVTCDDDQWLYLPGVGWLTAKRYRAYTGRSPRTGEPLPLPEKRLPFFNADPELYRALEGRPTAAKSFTDERARYFDALHPDYEANPDPTLEESFTVARFPWSDEMADEIRQCLLSVGKAVVPDLGVFEIVARPGRPGVNPQTGEAIEIPPRRVARFTSAPQAKERLSLRT
jgi:nucleoid DNA-binding protein